jgi:uncharacterized protein YecE (DUF72 family)
LSLEVWIGTSGYVYPDWVGGFYPPGTSSRRMLTHYAEHFPLVELNYTFYRPPTAQGLEALARRSPAGFQFIVKLHQSLTHDHDLTGAASFRDALEPLRQNGRLLGLLCQYPQRFHHDRRNRERLLALAGHFAGYPMAVEFRHRSWGEPEVPAWLGEHHLDLVSVDAPDLPNLYPTRLVQSSRLFYVRFHSRRGTSWYESDKERYNYLYNEEELRGWLDTLVARQAEADRAFLLFNNCRSSQAATNALQLRDLILRSPADFHLVTPFPFAEEDKQGLLF